MFLAIDGDLLGDFDKATVTALIKEYVNQYVKLADFGLKGNITIEVKLEGE